MQDEKPIRAIPMGSRALSLDVVFDAIRDYCDKTSKNILSQEEAVEVIRTAKLDSGDIVSAEWKYCGLEFVDTIECTNCGYQWPTDEFATRYCPDCGALMLNYENMVEDDEQEEAEEEIDDAKMTFAEWMYGIHTAEYAAPNLIG